MVSGALAENLFLGRGCVNLQDIIELESVLEACGLQFICRVAIQRQIEIQKEKESLWTNLKEVLSSLLEC